LDPPEDVAFWNWSPLAVSPDGRQVAFLDASGTRRLWVRAMDSLDARPLDGTAGAIGGFFWSPDSAWIAFAIADNELRKVSLAGGAVQRIGARPRGGYTG